MLLIRCAMCLISLQKEGTRSKALQSTVRMIHHCGTMNACPKLSVSVNVEIFHWILERIWPFGNAGKSQRIIKVIFCVYSLINISQS